MPKLLSLTAGAVVALTTSAAANEHLCFDASGKFVPRPTDANYCSCVNTLSQAQLAEYEISAAQAIECAAITGATTVALPPTDDTPPVAPPTDDDGIDIAKGNNGVGNGFDPPPPGIGNAGNDGGNSEGDAPTGTGPGAPGGSSTAPGRNK
jgi:hypothetical protein